MFGILGFLFHAWWAIGLLSIVLLVLAGAAFLRGYKTVAAVLAGAAMVHVYTGYIFQSGVESCAAKVRAEVAAEQARQASIGEAAVTELNARLSAIEGVTAADREALAAYEAELAARPNNTACTLTDQDVKAINGR